MKFVYSSILLVFAFPLPGQPQGQSPDPTDSIEAKVDAIFAEWDSTRSPGCALAVMKEGEVIYKRAYGMANLDYDVPLRTDSVFHVASVSKQFTAAAIVLLAQEGALILDDPVQKHLARVPDFGHRISLRNLIHHNSGMRDQWSLLRLAGWRYSRDLITDEDVMSLVSRQKELNYPPGDRYLYSNTGYTLLGQVVKEVSGQTLREFSDARIFKPLGMKQTFFRDDHSEIVKNQAIGYSRDRRNSTLRTSVTNFDTVGATSLLTTVEDLARWDRNFYQPLVGGEDFLEQMHQRGTLNSGEKQDYAYGLVHGARKGLRTVGHGGGDAGYRSVFLRFPEQRFTVACLCNLAQTNPGDLAGKVADLYLADELKGENSETVTQDASQEVRLSDEEISRLLGAYWSDERGVAVEVRHRHDRLELHLELQGLRRQAHVMKRVGNGRFEVAELGVSARFEPQNGEPVRRLIIWSVDKEGEEDSLQRLDPFDPGSANLEDYAGVYRSQEIDPPYRIEVGEQNLVLNPPKREPDELRPVAKDIFVGRIGFLRFERDAAGNISGFLLETGRIRNFRFQKRGEP